MKVSWYIYTCDSCCKSSAPTYDYKAPRGWRVLSINVEQTSYMLPNDSKHIDSILCDQCYPTFLEMVVLPPEL